MTATYPRTGKWSNLRTRFLEENRPGELERMKKDGTLEEYLNQIEDEYNERFARMEEDQLKKTQLEVRYGKREIDWQTYMGEFNQIRTNIAEILTEELCK